MIGRSTLAAPFTGLQFHNRGSFVRLSAVLFLVYMATGLWSPLLSVYTQSLGAGVSDIGLVLATFQVTSLLSQFWWGAWSDRLGRRKPLLLLGTAGLALAHTAIASSQSWRWLFPFRMLEGVALAAYSTGSLALIGDLLEDQRGRGRLMGLYRTFGSLAFALAALSGGAMADTWGIRVPFGLAASCYAGAFLLSIQITERPLTERATAGQDESPTSPAAPPSAAVWPFLCMVFLWTFAMGSIVFLWPVYMQDAGYSKTAVGRLWGLAALGEVPCLMLAGYLADRWGRKPVLIFGMVGMAAIYLGYTLSTALGWVIILQMFRSFTYASYEAPSLLYASELGLRARRGRLASLFYAASGGGGIVGSTVGGAMAQETGLVTMYRSVMGIMLVGVLLAGSKLPRLRAVREDG